jgi:hypothetical protein
LIRLFFQNIPAGKASTVDLYLELAQAGCDHSGDLLIDKSWKKRKGIFIDSSWFLVPGLVYILFGLFGK